MTSLRSAALLAVLVAAVSLLLPTEPGGSAAQSIERDNVESLRREASKARKELEKATASYESRKKKLAESESRLKKTLADLGAADAELNETREPLARLANVVYQAPAATGTAAMFGDSGPDQALRAVTDVGHIADRQNALIRKVAELRHHRENLASVAQSLQAANAVEQTRLAQEVESLKQRSGRLTKQLIATLAKIRADRERRLLAGCGPDKVAEARRYPNGLIPAKYLCKLPQQGEYLRADAARPFFKLNAAYKRRFGGQMCITDSYRSLSEQQAVYARQPGYAAVPGRSNHGYGTALDFCGGVQNSGSVQFNWLEANARKYGWFHPSWAYSSPFEPWHWEYDH